MQDVFNFEGKHVFIMGGTSGINLGIAECFARRSATVTVASRSQEKVDAAVENLQKVAPQAAGFSADVRDIESLASGLKSITDEFGPIDVMVVGQAGNFPAAAMELSPNGFKSVVDIDLLGTFNVIRTAHQYLCDSGAAIINISAPQGSLATEHQVHVCAAKAGVDMLTRVLAMELGEQNIRVNGIIPGPIEDTEGMSRLIPKPKETLQTVPLRRFGSTHDIGNCAVFLASPMAGYISGAIVPVDGGWSTGGFSSLSSSLASMAKD